MASLGKYCKIKTGKLDANASSEDGKYPFFTCAIEPLRIDIHAFDCEAILIAGNGDLNIKHYCGKFNAYQRTYVLSEFDKKHLLPRYAYHFLSKYVERLRQLSIGGVIKYIKLAMLADCQIPLPPLDEQRRIAAILDKADAVRRKRQEALKLADDLVKSQFIEMFGDPVTNPKGWDKQRLLDFFSFTTGKLDSNAATENGAYPFFTCSKETLAIDTFAFDCEALLLAGNNANADYSVKHYRGKFNAYQRTYVITLKNNANSYTYGKFFLEYKLGELKRISKGTNTKYLTLGLLGDMKILSPPVPLQTQFAAFVEQADKSKFAMQRQLDEAEAFKSALMQQFIN